MAASPWAKEWKNLANDSMAPANSQKAILPATFNKAYGCWPFDIPQQASDKLVAGRSPCRLIGDPCKDLTGPFWRFITRFWVRFLTIDYIDETAVSARLGRNFGRRSMTEQIRASQTSTQALTAFQQFSARESVGDERPDSNADYTFSLCENESLRFSVVDLFPVANPKLVITKDLDWRLWILRSRQERDEYKTFKRFEDRANGFIMMVAIMLEVFKLPSLAAAQLRFYQEVDEANDIYDFHSSIRACLFHNSVTTGFTNLDSPRPALRDLGRSATLTGSQLCTSFTIATAKAITDDVSTIHFLDTKSHRLATTREILVVKNDEPIVNVVDENKTTYMAQNMESNEISLKYEVRLQFVAIRNFITVGR
ncbi:hypothetical protein V8E54_013361 [Elaphomyces granulatus]